MTSIATVTGRVIDFLKPDPEQLSLDDIARGLARAPRYAGQTERPYSVLQHSLLVAHMVEPRHRLHALLHDAPEAYLCDVPSPAKEAMRQVSTGHGSAYDELEWRLWEAICRRWDIGTHVPNEVKEADTLAMLIEAPELQPLGWKHQIWNFAREIDRTRITPGAIHQFHGLLMEGSSLAVGRWQLAVAIELTNRKAAA